jgi:hypothetical protein
VRDLSIFRRRKRFAQKSDQFRVSSLGHLPNGSFANEDQKNEETANHVQAADNSQKYLKDFIKKVLNPKLRSDFETHEISKQILFDPNVPPIVHFAFCQL